MIITKRIIFILLLSMMFLPLIQTFHPFIKIRPLGGVFVEEKKLALSTKRWFSGEFQSTYEKYFEQNLGFRPFFVRFHNQMQYSFYQSTTVKTVIIGENNFLFQKEYVRSINGKNYNGREYMDYNMYALKNIQDSLKKRNNIDLIVVLAPGKAYVYPEFLQTKYLKKNNGLTNYEYYSKRLKEIGVNTIDFNFYFKKLKETSQELLFPIQGMHWSNYGATIAGDSIIKFIEKMRNIDLPDYKIEKSKATDIPNLNDNDLADLLNLLFEMKNMKYSKSEIKFSKVPKKDTCSVLTLSDSFFWTILGTNLPQNVFRRSDFWYYGLDIIDSKNKSVSTINYYDEIKKHNVIILLASEASLTIDKFPYGFVDKIFPLMISPKN